MSELHDPQLRDHDPIETREWMDSLDSVLQYAGEARAEYLLKRVLEHARHRDIAPSGPLLTDFVNTIHPSEEPEFPGDAELEKRLRLIIRWNAAVMVHRANEHFPGLGGHISTYASVAKLFEIGFNHFFRGKGYEGGSGDHVFFQGHASPGIYARSFLEGTLSEDHLQRFRREVERGKGLSSYPHPRLMPDYWEFPTVSMGLGPIAAIYQARFNRYLTTRGIVDTSNSRVWCFMGDGESRRAGVARRAVGRRARRSRQPDLRRQLQPAAPRRPGARQRQDHPGARSGLPRLWLERHQGRLGQRVGPAHRGGPRVRAACQEVQQPTRR
jgi:pyruvate dehydrogenase E1 component